MLKKKYRKNGQKFNDTLLQICKQAQISDLDIKVMGSLLRSGIKLDIKTRVGSTPLMLLTYLGKKSALGFLLKYMSRFLSYDEQLQILLPENNKGLNILKNIINDGSAPFVSDCENTKEKLEVFNQIIGLILEYFKSFKPLDQLYLICGKSVDLYFLDIALSKGYIAISKLIFKQLRHIIRDDKLNLEEKHTILQVKNELIELLLHCLNRVISVYLTSHESSNIETNKKEYVNSLKLIFRQLQLLSNDITVLGFKNKLIQIWFNNLIWAIREGDSQKIIVILKYYKKLDLESKMAIIKMQADNGDTALMKAVKGSWDYSRIKYSKTSMGYVACDPLIIRKASIVRLLLNYVETNFDTETQMKIFYSKNNAQQTALDIAKSEDLVEFKKILEDYLIRLNYKYKNSK